MDINKMTRKQFEELPYLDGFESRDVDSIVLLPSRKHHDSGYNIYEVVACYKRKALGKCYGYDTFSIYLNDGFNRVGIDCLRGSGLMRLFLPDGYEIRAEYHEIRNKVPKETMDYLERIADTIIPNIKREMWDKLKHIGEE